MAFWNRKKAADVPPPGSSETLVSIPGRSPSAPIPLDVNRDSVAAGDDVESHAFRAMVSPGEPMGATVQRILDGGYLPKIDGGKATWIVESWRPLAVVAQQWEKPRWLVPPNRPARRLLDAARPELRFVYWCQVEPDLLWPGLRAGTPIPDAHGRGVTNCNCRSHDEFYGENAERIAKESFSNLRDEGWQVLLRCRACWQNWLLERYSAQDHDPRPTSLRKLAPCVCEEAGTKEGRDAEDYLARHVVHAEPRTKTGDDLYRCLRTDTRWRRRVSSSPGDATFIRKAPEAPCRCTTVTTVDGTEAVAYLEGHLVWHSMTAMASERHYRCPDTGLLWLLDFEPFKPWEDAKKSLRRMDLPPYVAPSWKPLAAQAAKDASARSVRPHRPIAEGMRPMFWAGLEGRLPVPEPSFASQAWIGVAASLAGKDPAKPFDLEALIEAADMLDHAIPTWEELSGCLRILQDRGWLEPRGSVFWLTPAGRAELERHVTGTKDLFEARKHLATWLSENTPPVTAFVDLLCAELPDLAPVRDAVVRENGTLLSYIFIDDVVRWATRQFIRKELGDVAAKAALARLYTILDEALRGGPEVVRNLVAVGFLERLGGPPDPWWWQRLDFPPGLRDPLEKMWPQGERTLADLTGDQAQAPFPRLGGALGNFPLWDGYVAGYLSSAMQGTLPPAGAVGPDDETRDALLAIASRDGWTAEEQALMDYTSRLMEARAAFEDPKNTWKVPR